MRERSLVKGASWRARVGRVRSRFFQQPVDKEKGGSSQELPPFRRPNAELLAAGQIVFRRPGNQAAERLLVRCQDIVVHGQRGPIRSLGRGIQLLLGCVATSFHLIFSDTFLQPQR